MCGLHPSDDDLEMYVFHGSDPRAVAIEEHLRSCAHCAKRLINILEYVESMRAALERWKEEDHS
jgi:anti-sigma factor RsiW